MPPSESNEPEEAPPAAALAYRARFINCAILKGMTPVDILSDEFAAAAAEVGLRARQQAFDSGHWLVYVDKQGRIVQEMPDGTKFEIRFLAGMPRESHIEIIREIPKSNE